MTFTYGAYEFKAFHTFFFLLSINLTIFFLVIRTLGVQTWLRTITIPEKTMQAMHSALDRRTSDMHAMKKVKPVMELKDDLPKYIDYE